MVTLTIKPEIVKEKSKMNYQERKEQRKQHYEKHIKGWKQRPCSACSGSGRYDSHGSPKCGACEGTGKETYKPQT